MITDPKCSEKKMEKEDSVRTVDCLRGRLLAERMASRDAKDDADQLENKLIELEYLLKEEAKSRNRAEKKLKFLMKKFESMNISYDGSDESSENSILVLDKSYSSSVSSSTKESLNPQSEISTMYEGQESNKIVESYQCSENLLQIDLFDLSPDNSISEWSSSFDFEVSLQNLKGQECEIRSDENFEENSAKNTGVGHSSENTNQAVFNQSSNDSKTEEPSYHSIEFSNEESLSQEYYDQDYDDHTDNSMALILADVPQKADRIDPEVLDATVKEVLDSLRHAKEQIQRTMDTRRMNFIKVG